MPNLLSLPNELLLHKIIDLVEWNDPYDLKGLTLCCKEMSSIVKPKLNDHLEKRKQYSTMVVGLVGAILDDGTYQKSSSHPLVALANILSDDKNRLYPRTMYITGLEEDLCIIWECIVPENSRSKLESIAEEYRDRIVSTVVEVCQVLCPDSQSSGAHRWVEKIFGEGAVQQPAAAALLLLAICPNLEKLDISYHEVCWHADFQQNFSKITDLAMGPNADSKRAFRKLSEVHLSGSGQLHNGVDVKILCYFMALPNMTMVSATLAVVSDIKWPYEKLTSNMTELRIEHSHVDPDSLRELMSGVKALRAFGFTYLPKAIFGGTWQPNLVTQALQEIHGETLERLDLAYAEGEGEIHAHRRQCFIGDMRPFKILTEVRLNAFMLFDEGKPQRLIDVFPESIAAITIVTSTDMHGKVSTLSKEDVSAMFGGLGKGEDGLPNLRRVFLERVGIFEMQTKEGMKHLRELCDSRGIEIS